MAGRYPILTILLPTHNQAGLLEIAIKSILYQSFQDFEVLVVGDGCTDNSAEVVKSFQDERLIWYDLPKAPNFGYANRNVALKDAKGKYIGFTAHDDILFYDHFEKCINALESDEDKEIVCTRPVWISRQGEIIPIEFNLDNSFVLDRFIDRKLNQMAASCVVHRKDCFSKYGYWNDKLEWGGDWDMWARIIDGGGRNNFIYLRDPTILHFAAPRKKVLPQTKGRIHWFQLFNSSNDIPPELIIDIPDNLPEQVVVWERIQSDPKGWTKNLRKAIVSAFDLMIIQHGQLIKAIDNIYQSNFSDKQEFLNLENESLIFIQKLSDQNTKLKTKINTI